MLTWNDPPQPMEPYTRNNPYWRELHNVPFYTTSVEQRLLDALLSLIGRTAQRVRATHAAWVASGASSDSGPAACVAQTTGGRR